MNTCSLCVGSVSVFVSVGLGVCLVCIYMKVFRVCVCGFNSHTVANPPPQPPPPPKIDSHGANNRSPLHVQRLLLSVLFLAFAVPIVPVLSGCPPPSGKSTVYPPILLHAACVLQRNNTLLIGALSWIDQDRLLKKMM